MMYWCGILPSHRHQLWHHNHTLFHPSLKQGFMFSIVGDLVDMEKAPKEEGWRGWLYPIFSAKYSLRWPGNLSRYSISEATQKLLLAVIVDYQILDVDMQVHLPKQSSVVTHRRHNHVYKILVACAIALLTFTVYLYVILWVHTESLNLLSRRLSCLAFPQTFWKRLHSPLSFINVKVKHHGYFSRDSKYLLLVVLNVVVRAGLASLANF
jgi:hypothetical protein